MRSTGIVRRIDDLGRILIPKEVCKRCGIKEGDPLEIFMDGTTLVLEKYAPIMNYHDRFQEIISNMKDSDMPSEKVFHINQMFEAIEYMMKDDEAAEEE